MDICDGLCLDGQTARIINLSLSYVRQLVGILRENEGTDPQCIQTAWMRMQSDRGWSRRHAARVRGWLSAALMHVSTEYALSVHPTQNRGRNVVFEVERSHQRSFTMHECLPLFVRRLGNDHPCYRLLFRLTDEMTNHLRSVSKGNVQKMAAFIHHLIADPDDNGTQNESVRWTTLTHLSAKDWLERYQRCYPLGCVRITFGQFKRHMRYIRTLHGSVLCPKATVTVPVPSSASRHSSYSGLPEMSSTGTCISGFDVDQSRERSAVRDLVSSLRMRICSSVDPVEYACRIYAFEPREVRSILEAATTTEERLIVVLFLTTGLRIGGLSRLRWSDEGASGLRSPGGLHARDFPKEAITIEKNGKIRMVRLTDTVRILLAQWYNGLRSKHRTCTERYVFPGRNRDSVSTRHVWDVCHTVLTRAGVVGPHAHPHSFRHTVIQMLYLCGMKFESIAKWIGHANPTVTSTVYGRLSHVDVHNLMQGVPFIDGTTQQTDGTKGDWKSIASFVNRPYQFDASEWEGLNDVPPSVESRKRQALNYIKHVLG